MLKVLWIFKNILKKSSWFKCQYWESQNAENHILKFQRSQSYESLKIMQISI